MALDALDRLDDVEQSAAPNVSFPLSGGFSLSDSLDRLDNVEALPVAVIPGTPIPDGQIVWTCIFTFLPLPGQAADVNDGQTVETVVLDISGSPVVIGGVPQAPSTTGVYALGSNQYGDAYACPPGFSGSAQATLLTGPNAGQTNAQAINLGAAVDPGDVSFSAGPALTNVFDPNSTTCAAGSDVYLHALILGISNQTGGAVDPTGLPVAVAATTAAPYPSDFQAGDWLTVPSGPAAGSYARLKLSALAATALTDGAYRVTWQIGGTKLVPSDGVLIVRGGYAA